MTDFFSAEESDTVSIAPSPALPFPQLHHNLLTEQRYETAQQLIQHSHARRADCGGPSSVVEINNERCSSVRPVMAVTSPKEDHNPASNGNSKGNNFQPSEEMRASSSQEHLPESQYPPVSFPPAKGQMCR